MDRLFDMHCHLGFTPHPVQAAQDGNEDAISALSCTVEPAEYKELQPLLARCSNVEVALGAHPWWIADGRVGGKELQLFCALAANASAIGEIGLDFAGSRNTAKSREIQTDTFRRILAACNTGGEGKVLSIHAVHAANAALDLLEEAKIPARHKVIFHWFSGTAADLSRALKAGCFFSVGNRMLASRRGREYARQIPLAQMLLETDLPPRTGDPLPAELWREELESALCTIAEVKSLSPGDALAVMNRSAAQLLA